jgi:ATP-dependent protease HslVU (ClpYQ) peptidase subunit
MTTVATDGLSMAGDGLRTFEGRRVSTGAIKVHHLPDGRVVGFAGSSSSIARILAWLKGEAEKPTIGDDEDDIAVALCLDASGLIEVIRTPHLTPIDLMAPAAIGSGADLAIGAMAKGASAREAVDIAGRFDTATGGAITELRPRAA